MKRARVMATGSVLAAVILFVCLVPVPVSRIRGVGLVQAHPESVSKLYVQHPGLLKELKVRVGDTVRKGDVLAVFSNRDIDAELGEAITDRETNKEHVRSLERALRSSQTESEKAGVRKDIGDAQGKVLEAEAKIESLERKREKELTMRAPRDGVIGQAPRIDDVGKSFEKDSSNPFLTIIEPGRLQVCLPVVTNEFNLLRENLERPTAAAQETLRLLQKKRVTVQYKETPLAAVLSDLRQKVKGLHVEADPSGEVADSQPVSFEATDERLAAVLDGLLGKYGLGYVVRSEDGDGHDGWVEVRPGRERGYPEGPRELADLGVTLRVNGLEGRTWKGRVTRLPESEARVVPLALSNRAGGPVAVKAGGRPEALVPQTQHYLVYVDILDPDAAIMPGTRAQVKVHCRPETCAHWLWRKVNDLFDLGLL